MLVAILAATGVAGSPRAALAIREKGPVQITPEAPKGKERRRARRADVDRSDAGTRRGILELTLGSIVMGTAGLLVGRGGWEIVRARQIEEDCQMGGFALECSFLRPGRQSRIAAGLSFGFAGVLGLAAGFLLVRGIRTNRDYREWTRANAQLSVQPWAGRDHAGVSMRLRF